MVIGIPKEIKEEESRVAITSTGVSAFISHGHQVIIEKGAGLGSGILDRTYEAAGATLLESPREIWERSALIMKVKEAEQEEWAFLRPGLILYAYLHLAANEKLARTLVEKKVTSIAYETIQLEDGSLPLLTPMSEIAGRLSLQVGAWCLQAENGGRGLLLGGASGVRPGKVVILGAGIAGSSACHVATGMGAYVSILDVNPSKLRYIHDILGGRITTLMSNRANLEEASEAATVLRSEIIDTEAISPPIALDDEALEEAIEEALFVLEGESASRDEDRFQRSLAQVDRYVEDQIMIVQRRSEKAHARRRTAEEQRDGAIGADARTRAEESLRRAQQEVDELESELNRLQARDDEVYKRWRDYAHEKRYAAAIPERLLDIEFEVV